MQHSVNGPLVLYQVTFVHKKLAIFVHKMHTIALENDLRMNNKNPKIISARFHRLSIQIKTKPKVHKLLIKETIHFSFTREIFTNAI